MTTTTATRTATDQISADIRQLTKPIHIAAGRRIVQHPPLLEQLRAAIVPGRRADPAARPATAVPSSRPPVRLDAVDVLSDIYVGIAAWRVRLNIGPLPRHLDWQTVALRRLADAALRLDPPRAGWLAADVHEWWLDAAITTGWQPRDLLRIR